MAMTDRDLQVWKQRLGRAKAVQAAQHPRWQQSLDLYRMRFFNQQGLWKPDDDEDISVNFATTFIKRMLQATYARNPKIFVEARRPRYVNFADSMQTVVNYFWDDLDIKNSVIKVYRDALLFGIGWLEVGWFDTYDAPPSPTPQPESDEAATLIASLKQMLRGKPEAPVTPVSQGELHTLVKEGQPFVRHRPPWRVFLPDGFHDVHEMPYLLMEERLRLSDFLNTDRYRNRAKVAPHLRVSNEPGLMQKPSFESTQGPHTRSSAWFGEVSDTQTVSLVHAWDREEGRYLVFSDQADHLEVDWPYYPDGYPLLQLTFNDIPEGKDDAYAYPFGDLEPIFSQLIEKTNIRRQMASIRKRINPIVFARKSSTTETEVRNYTEGLGVEVIGVTDPTAITAGPELRIPRDVFAMEGSIDNDLERDTALNLLISNLSAAKDVDTATLAMQLQGAANLETGFRVERLEDYSKRVARYLSGLCWQKASRRQVGEILGELPDEDHWLSLEGVPPDIARQRIQRELVHRIDAGSTKPMVDEAVRRQQKIAAVAVMQNTDPLLFKRISRFVFADLVKDLGFKELEKIVLDALDQQAMDIAMQENQLLLQGHPQLVGEAEDHESHIMVHQQAAGHPLVDQHILAHAQAMQQMAARQQTAGQGVRQRADAPSAAEVRQGGTPAASDVTGTAMNMRKGTGAEAVAV